MKKFLALGMLGCILLLNGCSSQSEYGEEYGDGLNDVEYLEGYEGLSDEETTQKLIEEADKMEIVPDKTK